MSELMLSHAECQRLTDMLIDKEEYIQELKKKLKNHLELLAEIISICGFIEGDDIGTTALKETIIDIAKKALEGR